MAIVAYGIFRIGEISLKGKNTATFMSILRRNIMRLVADYLSTESTAKGLRTKGVRIETDRNRIQLWMDEESDIPLWVKSHILPLSYGCTSFSPAIVCPSTLEAIQEKATKWATTQTPTSFRVTVKRSYKGFPMISSLIARELGATVLNQHKDWHVDLHEPKTTLFIEIQEKQTLLFGEKWPGPGGLPVGSAGKVVMLLSGGIDSPVAASLLQKRGATIIGVHFHTPPFTTEQAVEKVRELGKIIAKSQGQMKLYLIPITKAQKAIRDHTPDRLGVIYQRRFMLRIAEKIAKRHKSHALATGESLGQVASQTLPNMAATSAATNLPILRPLIGMDKTEIIDIARRIGSFETSILPFEDCCHLFAPQKPEVHANLKDVEQHEEALDINDLVTQSVAEAEKITI